LEIDYNIGNKPRVQTDHRTVATALGMMVEPEDLGLHMRRPHRAVMAGV
jgi:hypothetical protein